MIKLLVFIIFTSIAVCIGPMLADNQGFVHVATKNHIVETSITTAITLYLLSVIIIMVVFSLTKRIINLPKGTLRAFRNRAFKKKLSIQDEAYIDFAQGQYETSLGLLKHSSSIKNMSEKSLLVAAQSAFHIGLYDFTRRALDEAQSRGKKAKLAADVVRAKLNFDIGNAKAALEYLEGTNGAIKNNFVCSLYLNCYKALNKLDKIVDMTKDLIKYNVINEEQARKYYIAFIDKSLKDSTTAQELEALFKKIAKSDKKDDRIMSAFIFKLIKLGDVNRARELSLDLLKSDPSPVFLESVSHWDIAIPDVLITLKKYASKNIITSQVNLPLLKAMANLEYKSGLMRDALEDYQQALTIEPSSEIYLKVGTILTGMQKFNEATEYYTKANTLLNDYSILVAPTDK